MKKEIVIRLIGLLSLLVCIPVYAYDFTDSGLFYNLKSDGTLEVAGMATSTTIADIPSTLTINGTKYRVTSIGRRAFADRSDITYLSIPYSITSIGEYAFVECGSSMTVNIADPESWCKMALGNEHSSPLSSAGKVLVHDIETTSIEIPETVTSIGAFTFYQCRSITSLYIPGSVKSIGSSAFEDCTGLTTVTLSKGLTSIGGSSFEGCKGLTSITIPSTVSSIALNAFKDCTSLNTITSEIKNPFAIDENVFGTYSSATLSVPVGTKTAYQSTAGWKKFAKIIEHPSGEDNLDYANQYLTFVAKESGTFSFNGTKSDAIDNSRIYYSLDNGNSWTPMDRNSQSPIIQAGNKIMFKGVCKPIYYYVEGAEAIIGIGVFSSTGRFDVEGNVMSMLYGDNFIGQTNLTGKDYAFSDLFSTSSGLLCADNLVLPATILSESCYEGMFRSCTSLISTPQLPAKTLAKSCYTGMFWGCTSLTLAPQLPALTLDVNCYANMFGFCTSLTTAPILPATTLAEQCYRSMFNACTSLIKITCLAMDISASQCTYNWVRNVPSLGTFIKSSSMNSWTRGIDGIPTNWTIQNNDGSTTNEFVKNGFSFVVDNSSLTAKVKSVDTSLRNVIVPESVNYNGIEYRVTALAERSFEGRSDITYLSIPSSITSIGEYAFVDCGSNIEVNIESLEAWCKITFKDRNSSPLSSAKSFYLNNVEVKNLLIPSGVTSIPAYAFYQSKSITSLDIPSTVTSIGSSAFEDCKGLTSVNLSRGLTSIGGSSFEGCSSISSITLPSTVTSIALNAFKDCVSLNNITSEIQNPFAIDENVFSTYSTAILIVPAGTKSAYQSTAGWYKFINITDGQDVVLTANSYTREYGEVNPVFDYTREGDELIGTPTITCDATNTSPVGTYTIRITKGSVANSNVSYIDGTLTITKAPLTVTAKDCSREQGQDNPTFEVSYSGFKNNETEAVLTKKPTASTTATVSSAPGQYDITVSGGEAKNYNFIYKNGVLTVTEKDEISFTIDGTTYLGKKSAKTVVVKSVDKGLVSVEIPASVGNDGTTYQVTGIDNDALKGSSMAALIWNVEAALPNTIFSNSSIGSNFLLYVKVASYAPSSVKNVVVDGTAQSILLSDDGGQFYSPKAFTAQIISYTHNYSMETGGDGKGWETIALPFDVQRISHSKNGEIVPFASYSSSSEQKPFWLANFSGSSFRRTSAIKANEPYIIAMPNSSNYNSSYILAGDVSFSAENVQVTKTPSFSGLFVPTYATVARSSTVHALNVNNRYVKYSGAYDAGSHFISNLRDIRPFEAYMTGGSSTRGVIEINFEDGATDLDDILLSSDESREIIIYTLSGQQVSRTTQHDFDHKWNCLPKGVYIVNGKKWIK